MHPIIKTVSLRVRDLERSTAFYTGVLGLVPQDSGNATRKFLVEGDSETIVRLEEAPDARGKPPRALGLYHFAILVPSRPDLAAVLRRLAERGVRLQGASDHKVSEALYLADPDGHGIEIYRDRSPDEWTYTPHGELHMTTDPLDLQQLAAEAPEAAGLPQGTTIGHIHLHVSDLKKAETFYAEGLGFDVTVRSYPGALFLSTASYHHHIGLNTWAGPSAEKPSDNTIGMIAFSMHPPKRPSSAPETLVDPDGTRIELTD